MRWLGRLGWCDLQVVGREPYHLTVTIHFGVDRAVGCPDYSALRERLAPKAIVTNKLNAIPRLECVHSHLPPSGLSVAPPSFFVEATTQRAAEGCPQKTAPLPLKAGGDSGVAVRVEFERVIVALWAFQEPRWPRIRGG